MADTITEKRCADCKEMVAISEFGPSTINADGLASYCYPCRRVQNKGNYKRWTPEQREAHRERVIRCRYGVDIGFIHDLYQRQEGCCAICDTPGEFPTTGEKGRKFGSALCIDHCHETGEVRGLLCRPCNQGLGFFSDDVPRIIRALSYLSERGAE